MAKLPATGVVDADGHVLEPADLWLDYLEAPYRDRAIRVRVDDAGLEYLEIDGAPFERLSHGGIAMLGAMGDETARPGPDRRYMDVMPFGACDPGERIEWLDKEQLDAVVLYPTIGIIWESAVDDAELSDAYARAYNRWIADFCRDSGGRLVPVAHLSLSDPDRAARELERAVADGCRGAFVAPFTWTRVAHGHPDHDVVWATAERLGVPIGIHPTYEPDFANTLTRFRNMSSTPGVGDPGAQLMSNLVVRQGVQQAFMSFFTYGTLQRFPGFTLGVLESAAGWIGSLLDRMDALFRDTMLRHLHDLTERPSDYFRRQCFISCDPEETAAPLIIDHVGRDRFIWATDYPHPDHPANWRTSLERFVEPLDEETTAAVVGRNVLRLYSPKG
jgi:predicted TIM-barrel fold metal-dependent hydrolase